MTEERRQELQSIVAEVVRSRFPGTEFPAIRLRPELDHDGDPVLVVEIYFRPEDEELRRSMGLEVELIRGMQNRLWAIGETRFPHPEFLRAADARD